MSDAIEKWTMEDGRRAERHVTNNGNEKIMEVYVEDSRPLRLQQRMVEKTKPFIYERKIETLDKDGNVIEQKTEAVEPKVQMQLVEHIVADKPIKAQSVGDCITREEMLEAIKTAVSAMKETSSFDVPSSVFADKLSGLSVDTPPVVAKPVMSWVDMVIIGFVVLNVVAIGWYFLQP